METELGDNQDVAVIGYYSDNEIEIQDREVINGIGSDKILSFGESLLDKGQEGTNQSYLSENIKEYCDRITADIDKQERDLYKFLGEQEP